jgi:Mg/Co/Ni transporter MgtE
MLPEQQLQVFEDLAEDQAVRLLALMAPDLAADLVVRHLDPPWAKRCIEQLPAAGADRIIDLLRYPDETAGGIMTNDILAAPAWLTLKQARSDLLVKDEQSLLGEIVRRDVVAVDPLEPGVAAARRVVEEHLSALPVVARDGRLLAAITVDAAVAILTPATWRDHGGGVASHPTHWPAGRNPGTQRDARAGGPRVCPGAGRRSAPDR